MTPPWVSKVPVVVLNVLLEFQSVSAQFGPCSNALACVHHSGLSIGCFGCLTAHLPKLISSHLMFGWFNCSGMPLLPAAPLKMGNAPPWARWCSGDHVPLMLHSGPQYRTTLHPSHICMCCSDILLHTPQEFAPMAISRKSGGRVVAQASTSIRRCTGSSASRKTNLSDKNDTGSVSVVLLQCSITRA